MNNSIDSIIETKHFHFWIEGACLLRFTTFKLRQHLVFGLIQSFKTYWWQKEKKDLLFYFILLIINLQTVFSFLFDNLLKIVIRLKLKIDGFLWNWRFWKAGFQGFSPCWQCWTLMIVFRTWKYFKCSKLVWENLSH